MNKHFTVDSLKVGIYESRDAMGCAGARDIAAAIRAVLAKKNTCNMIFAAAPSQNEMLASLTADGSIAWNRVNAYHMDEYVGLSPDAPQAFGTFLRQALFSKVPLRSVHYIAQAGSNPEEICSTYAQLLKSDPTDIVCLGIGENGHIAFNDPHAADFHDPLLMKPVALDEVCRMQQVNDGCFSSLAEVPTHALTLTIPALTGGERLFCVVPATTKAPAVCRMLCGEITEACPATVLRRHPNCTLYLDPGSASLL